MRYNDNTERLGQLLSRYGYVYKGRDSAARCPCDLCSRSRVGVSPRSRIGTRRRLRPWSRVMPGVAVGVGVSVGVGAIVGVAVGVAVAVGVGVGVDERQSR